MSSMIDDKSSVHSAAVLLSGSAGELDWVLPILDSLLKKGFNLKIIFLTRHSRSSVQKNRMLNDFISQENSQLQTHMCGGYFFEKVEHFSYFIHRASIKFNFTKKPIVRNIYNFLSKVLKKFYLNHLPSNVLLLKKKKCLFFSEFPKLRRPSDQWLRDEFRKAIFFYCPHSPHIYAENLDKNYSTSQYINYGKNYFLLLGHPADFSAINDGKELAADDLERVFLGHPKYSNNWLLKFKEKSHTFRSSISNRNEVNILVLSRGIGGYLDSQSHLDLVDMTIEGVCNEIKNYNLLIKKHPRELNSHWDVAASANPAIKIIDDHMMNIATSVDFVISFWGSGAMDCYALGVPVIELFDPNKHPKQQIFYNKEYTTIYRLLGIVLPANNLKELVRAISSLKNNNFLLPSHEPHPFFNELMSASNEWNTKIDKILVTHNLINN